MASILTSTKKLVGLDEEYEHFDVDIISYINSTFSTLNQLGIGPENGFMIEDKSVQWEAYLPDDLPKLGLIRTYMGLKVKMLFDPPTTGYFVDAANKQIAEAEWRLSVFREEEVYVPNYPDGELH